MPRPLMRKCLLALLLFVPGQLAWPSVGLAQGVLAAFTVLGPDGAVARAVVDGAACPAATVDGRALPMQVRAPADARFPLICDAHLPADAASVRIGTTAVPVPHAEIRRLVLFGDSGCRVDAHESQPCNDPAKWPFARTSAAGAALAPDLVIHVGDYLYRESPCPPSEAGCAGSPSGDDWPAWRADFFAPAAPLLRAAPWVMVRGNHEICRRAGEGFFRLLDPRKLPATCPKISPTYRVRAGTLTFFVLDSGEANDTKTPDDLVATYRTAFAAIDATAGAWILTHRPIWGIARVSSAAGDAGLANYDATLEAASGNKLPAGVALVVSGHIHLFEALSFADGRAPQLIFGTAGSSLSDAIDADVAGHAIAGTTIAYGRTLHAFGVSTMERAGDGWTATLRDEDGTPRFTCAIDGPKIGCQP